MVRGYTLPLGVLDAPSFTSKANCVAVCSFTGRVAVVMGSVLNIWQCSQGFFEHVMELKVDMTQRGAFHELEFVAIHGVYVALGSSTEVRVMEIHVQHEAAGDRTVPSIPVTFPRNRARKTLKSPTASDQSPEDDSDCIHFRPHEDMDMFESIPIPLASYGEGPDDRDHQQVHERSMVSEYEGAPLILDRNEALQEECLLAGLVRGQDMRVNRALHYSVDEGDVKVLLRRFLPPNQRIKKLSFLPETIDNLMSLDSRRYTRLLIGTHNQAFLYFFLSDQTDVTRKKMAKKVFGGGSWRGTHGDSSSYRAPRFDSVPTGTASAGHDADSSDADSRRVVMHYSFSAPISAITANSSFLFVATCSTIQVWSIWSPCHQMAATRALTSDSLPEPARPQLISVQSLKWPVRSLAALDSYVVVLPHNQLFHGEVDSREFVRMTSFAANHLLPTAEIELRGINAPLTDSSVNVGTLILQQSPASSILASVRAASNLSVEDRVELLLTLFAVYRYRADVGWSLLNLPDQRGGSNDGDRREQIALKLETELYDALAGECAADLANEFLSSTSRDLSRAALFFAASRVLPSTVIQSFYDIVDEEGRAQVLDAIQRYLDASLFATTTSSNPQRISNRAQNHPGFTRMALQHFLEHVPAQFTRLLIDSSLPWTIEDLQFGLQALSVSAASDQLLLKIAHIVLILRTASLLKSHRDQHQQAGSNEFATLRDECSHVVVERLVDEVMAAEDGTKELIRLCVEHPDLLELSDDSEGTTSPTLLAQAMFSRAPTTFTHILMSLFKRGVANRASVMSTSAFCIRLIGDVGRGASERVTSLCTSEQLQDPSCWFAEESFGADHCIFTRFLSFLLDETPRLHQLAEKDEINEDDIALEKFHGAIAAEFVRECVILVSSAEKGILFDSLASLFTDAQDERDILDKLPSWETDFIDQKILPLFVDTGRSSLARSLLCRGVHLVDRTGTNVPNWVVRTFESRVSKTRGEVRWKACNHYANLLILLSLAKLDRYVVSHLSVVVELISC
ncbi:hypothetical protein PINS_up016020 [Pythium insidiosum]|nr:hypothetical protein PINS_up016020 [Pythium insidiosum]